ncbi:MAG: hypothetical protein C0504_19555 [Candidatus Solibacter sp.]|nr:hypothetical protein [Candidatus Solibacter sp.]
MSGTAEVLDKVSRRLLVKLIDGFVRVGAHTARGELAFWVDRVLLMVEHGRRLQCGELRRSDRKRVEGRLRSVLRSMRTSIEDCERRALETVTSRQAD